MLPSRPCAIKFISFRDCLALSPVVAGTPGTAASHPQPLSLTLHHILSSHACPYTSTRMRNFKSRGILVSGSVFLLGSFYLVFACLVQALNENDHALAFLGLRRAAVRCAQRVYLQCGLHVRRGAGLVGPPVVHSAGYGMSTSAIALGVFLPCSCVCVCVRCPPSAASPSFQCL